MYVFSLFPIRVVALWNILPASVVLIDICVKFKSLLKDVGLSYAL